MNVRRAEIKDIPGILRAYPDYFKDCIVSKLTGERDNMPDDDPTYVIFLTDDKECFGH